MLSETRSHPIIAGDQLGRAPVQMGSQPHDRPRSMASTFSRSSRQLGNCRSNWSSVESVDGRETDDEVIEVQRRADHCHPAGAGGGGSDGGCLPQARHQQRDVLQVEGEVRWAGGIGCPPAEGARGRERKAEEASRRSDARQRHAEGRRGKKMVTPVARREAVAHLQRRHEVSQRRACRTIGADRSSIRYRSRRPDDSAIRARLRELAASRRRFGYRRLQILLRREGAQLNHKKLRRLYAEERLQVRRRGGRKRALGSRTPMAIPRGPNQRWSLDFVSDAMTDGRRFRILAVVDDFYARVPLPGGRYLALRAGASHVSSTPSSPAPPARHVCFRQRHRADQHGDPAMVARTPGSTGTTSHPASPPRTPSSRASMAASATSCLNETLFISLAHARAALDVWKDDYNTVRPHSSLGNLPPAAYAKLSVSAMQRDGTLRSLPGFAPRPVAPPSQTGSNDERDSTHPRMRLGAQVRQNQR